MEKQAVLEKLKAIKPHLKDQYGVTELALFGSYSRGEQTENSDIDIMIDLERPMGMRFLKLIGEIESLFDKEVQVVGKKAIKPAYFECIKPDLLYV